MQQAATSNPESRKNVVLIISPDPVPEPSNFHRLPFFALSLECFLEFFFKVNTLDHVASSILIA